uniref:Uncharacterized protein n=1 Tax=Opuntia streptacantha TaxID=393608 RepID=A0A7C9E5N0_OPUST
MIQTTSMPPPARQPTVCNLNPLEGRKSMSALDLSRTKEMTKPALLKVILMLRKVIIPRYRMPVLTLVIQKMQPELDSCMISFLNPRCGSKIYSFKPLFVFEVVRLDVQRPTIATELLGGYFFWVLNL